MKFQLALDLHTTEEALETARELADLVQVLEIGTPLVLREGCRAIEAMRAEFPGHEILADFKIMDAGAWEARIAFEAGASIVTVCGCANNATIRAAIEQAAKNGGAVSIDMIETTGFEKRAAELDGFGAAYLQVHAAADTQKDKSPLDELLTARRILKKTGCAVAGGIGPGNIAAVLNAKPDLVIVGGKITQAADRRAEMLRLLDIARGK